MHRHRRVLGNPLWLAWIFLVVDGACGADDSTRPDRQHGRRHLGQQRNRQSQRRIDEHGSDRRNDWYGVTSSSTGVTSAGATTGDVAPPDDERVGGRNDDGINRQRRGRWKRRRKRLGAGTGGQPDGGTVEPADEEERADRSMLDAPAERQVRRWTLGATPAAREHRALRERAARGNGRRPRRPAARAHEIVRARGLESQVRPRQRQMIDICADERCRVLDGRHGHRL